MFGYYILNITIDLLLELTVLFLNLLKVLWGFDHHIGTFIRITTSRTFAFLTL